MTLRGPADADHYRVQVGRYRDRWYVDPLPTCPIAEATDGQWPSVSTVKKGGNGQDWSFVALKRVAQVLTSNPLDVLVGADFGSLYDRLKSINQRGLERAAARGTNVHAYFERGLRGQPIEAFDPNEPGAEYVDAVRAFFDQYQPELVAAEVVAINRTLNGVGYGGTGDAIIKIEHDRRSLCLWPDWKSRGEDSNHAAYPEEGAQDGAYGMAEYLIVEGADGPKRIPVPELDGGLIVSVKPDGCRLYPIDLGKAGELWTELHRWWCARQHEREAIGKPWAPRKIKDSASVPTAMMARDADEVADVTASRGSGLDAAPGNSSPASGGAAAEPEWVQTARYAANVAYGEGALEEDNVDELHAALDKIAAPAPHPAVTPPAGEGTAGTSPAEFDPVPHVDEHETRRGLLLARFMDLCDDDRARFRALDVDRDDLDAVEKALDEVDPFAAGMAGELTSSVERPSVKDSTPSLPHPSDEGADVDDATFEALQRTFVELPHPTRRQWIHNIIREADQANVSFLANKSTGRRTVRRFELYRGLISLAAADIAEDELVRQLVATVLDSDAPFFPIFTVGECVGSLDVGGAEMFASLCFEAVQRPAFLDVRSHPAVA